MGCLNDHGAFPHWFGNVHLSGPCNRSCYFCIGQHMMALDPLNVLDTWPLAGIDEFIAQCRAQQVKAVYVTGTNTDPLLFRHTRELVDALQILAVPIGVRTNGVAFGVHRDRWDAYDVASLTICSVDQAVNRKMMGGACPNYPEILASKRDIKVNIVLGPEQNLRDLESTLNTIACFGPRRVNFREPYGQPHVGDPMLGKPVDHHVHGMPVYQWGPLEVCYWDVHYCEVESVNLYASGRVSLTYPITKGHADNGEVWPQDQFSGGRVRAQWLNIQSDAVLAGA